MSEDLGIGSVLVLLHVSIFTPSPRSRHLNVTPDNIVQLFSATSGSLVIPRPTKGFIYMSMYITDLFFFASSKFIYLVFSIFIR